MTRKFVPFEEVEALASIEQLADMLGLPVKPSGQSLRCPCPKCGGDERTLVISPQVRSKRGSLGVFFCQRDKTGGDRIGLVAHCMDIGQQDAAFFIHSQLGDGDSSSKTGTVDSTVKCNPRATVPQADQKGGTNRPEFDPAVFAAKLQFTDEVAKLGFAEDDAKALGVGFYRGKVYLALRHPNGDTAGFVAYQEGQPLKLPPKWLSPKEAKLLHFARRA